MKKWIACVLAFCLIVSLSAYGPMATAAAEEQTVAPVTESTSAVETPRAVETVLVSVTAQPDEGTAEPASADSTESETVIVTPVTTEISATGEDDATSLPTETTESPESADGAAETGESATTTPENTDTQTPESTVTQTPEATATTVPVVTAAPAAATEANVGSGPVWVVEGAHRRYGQLSEILPIAIVTGQTLYFSSASVLELKGYSVSELRSVSFGLDQDALGKDFCHGKTVVISAISPSGAMRDGSLYLWVGRASDVPSTSDALEDTVQLNDEDVLESEIEVDPAGYSADAPCAPSFTLTAHPALTADSTFAVILNGGDPQAISGNTFAPAQSGEYRFAVLNADGTLAARSMVFMVEYGSTAEQADATDEPESAEASQVPATETTPEATADADQPDVPASADATPEPETTEIADATVQPETTGEPTDAAGEPDTADVTTEPETTVEPEEADTTVQPDTADATEEPTLNPEATTDPSELTQEDLAELAAGTPELAETPEISVRAYDYVEGTVSGVAPSFALSGAPVGGGYTYGIILNGQAVTPLAGDTYCVTANGESVFAFCLLDSEGTMVDLSTTYHVLLDVADTTVSKQAWMEVDGQQVYGTLASLVESAPDGTTIYLLTNDVIALSDTAKLSRVHLAPDPGMFENGSYVIVSTDSPEGE